MPSFVSLFSRTYSSPAKDLRRKPDKATLGLPDREPGAYLSLFSKHRKPRGGDSGDPAENLVDPKPSEPTALSVLATSSSVTPRKDPSHIGTEGLKICITVPQQTPTVDLFGVRKNDSPLSYNRITTKTSYDGGSQIDCADSGISDYAHGNHTSSFSSDNGKLWVQLEAVGNFFSSVFNGFCAEEKYVGMSDLMLPIKADTVVGTVHVSCRQGEDYIDATSERDKTLVFVNTALIPTPRDLWSDTSVPGSIAIPAVKLRTSLNPPIHQLYGKNKNGADCRDCMRKGGYCWRHQDQAILGLHQREPEL